MLKLSEIMTREVFVVTPETTLRDAVELFAEKHISGAPVVSGHEIVGVVSAADVLEFAASMPDPAAERSRESLWSDLNVEERAENVAPGSYYTDLFSDEGTDEADHMRPAAELQVGVLENHTVDDVMTRPPITLSPNDSVFEAADLMRRHGIHRVPVVDAEQVVGIVSALDVARAVAEHKLVAKTYVFNHA
jgi:CBS domain-containing protein